MFKKIDAGVILVFFLLSLTLVLIWFKENKLIIFHDEVIPLNKKTIEKYFYNWMERGLGETSGVNLKLINFVFFYIFYSLGINTIFIEKILYFVFIFIGLSGMYFLSKEISPFKNEFYRFLSGFVSALIYLFNLYFIQYIVRLNYIVTRAHFFAFMPIVIFFYIKYLNERKTYYLIGLMMSSILIIPSFSHPTFFISYLFLLISYPIFDFFIKSEKSYLKRVLIVFIFIIFLNFFWIYPRIFTSNKEFEANSINAYFDFLKDNSRESSILNIFRFLSPPFFENLWYKFDEFYKYNYIISLIPIVSFIIPFLSLIFFKKNKEIIYFSSILLFSIFFIKGIHDPFGNIFYTLFAKFDVLKIFRDPFKFGFVYILSFSVLYGIGFSSAMEKASQKINSKKNIVFYIPLILTIFFIFFYSWPMFTGDVIIEKNVFPSSKTEIPGYYHNLSSLIEKNGEYRILVLPLFSGIRCIYNFNEKDGAYITWKGCLIQQFVDKPVISSYSQINNIKFYNYTDILDENLLELFNIRYIIIDKNIDYNYTLKGFNTSDFIRELEKRNYSKTISGNLEIYELKSYGSKINIIYNYSNEINSKSYFISFSDVKKWNTTRAIERKYFVRFLDNNTIEVSTNLELEKTKWSWISTYKFDVNVGVEYIVETSMKTLNTNSSHIVIQAWDNEKSKGQLKQCPPGYKGMGDNEWKYYNCTFKIPNNVNKVSIFLNAGGVKNKTQGPAITWFGPINIRVLETIWASNLNITKKELNYTKINPTLYKVQVNSTEPFMLSFAESYDPLWEARVYKNGKLVEKSKPVPLYGVINGFWINTTGENLEIVIRYTPQDYFEIGLIISGTTLAACIAYLIYDWKRNFFNEKIAMVLRKEKYRYKPKK